MPRPLTPLSEERIKEYEKELKHAFSTKNKEEIKRWRRLFLEYINKREHKIKDFKNTSIYQYFEDMEKPKRKDVLKKQIEELKIEYEKYKDYDDDSFEKSRIVNQLINKENELERLIKKMYQMRERRKKLIESGRYLTKEETLVNEIKRLRLLVVEKEEKLFNDYQNKIRRIESDFQYEARKIVNEYNNGIAGLKELDKRIDENIKRLERLQKSGECIKEITMEQKPVQSEEQKV